MALRARGSGVAVKSGFAVLVLSAALGSMGALVLDAHRQGTAALPAAATPEPTRKPNSAYHCNRLINLDPDTKAIYLKGLRDIYGRYYEPCAGRDQGLIALLERPLAATPTPRSTSTPARSSTPYVIGQAEEHRQ